jgi:hypothetical protein
MAGKLRASGNPTKSHPSSSYWSLGDHNTEPPSFS